jgi:RNA polymerase sigma factor (sigma-70 family)
MPAQPEALLRYIRQLALPRHTDGQADAELLQRFARDHDEEAFARLVAGHGALVLAAARRVLRDRQAAEDVFQATFLVLARRPSAVGAPDRLAAWLYGVARHLALKCHHADKRRQLSETLASRGSSTGDLLDELTGRELLGALDEELDRLPENYRLAVLLVCLDGKSLEAATPESARTMARGRLSQRRARSLSCQRMCWLASAKN